MITKFKIFEEIHECDSRNGYIFPGTYIITKIYEDDDGWNNYINNQIGKVICSSTDDAYEVKYYVDDFIYDKFFKTEMDKKCIKLEYDKKIIEMRITQSEIKYWSDNKDDLEIILAANKYNI